MTVNSEVNQKLQQRFKRRCLIHVFDLGLIFFDTNNRILIIQSGHEGLFCLRFSIFAAMTDVHVFTKPFQVQKSCSEKSLKKILTNTRSIIITNMDSCQNHVCHRVAPIYLFCLSLFQRFCLSERT